MPTIITHPAVALLKTWFPRVPRRAAATGALLTILPDADVAAFALNIPYHHPLGHRGFTHSIAFALLTAGAGTLLLRPRTDRAATFAFLFTCAVSHPLLDALTDGGLGVALVLPDLERAPLLPLDPNPRLPHRSRLLQRERRGNPRQRSALGVAPGSRPRHNGQTRKALGNRCRRLVPMQSPRVLTRLFAYIKVERRALSPPKIHRPAG